jgi:hypothetical protein
MPTTPTLRNAFDPGAVKVLSEAFDDAWRSLQSSRNPAVDGARAARTRDMLARRIIEGAEQGERNPRRLRDYALERLDTRLRA